MISFYMSDDIYCFPFQVTANYRNSITIPKRGWVDMRDIIGESNMYTCIIAIWLSLYTQFCMYTVPEDCSKFNSWFTKRDKELVCKIALYFRKCYLFVRAGLFKSWLTLTQD